MAISNAMMAMTTRSSISVNPIRLFIIAPGACSYGDRPLIAFVHYMRLENVWPEIKMNDKFAYRTRIPVFARMTVEENT
jgi:hypothetical protein